MSEAETERLWQTILLGYAQVEGASRTVTCAHVMLQDARARLQRATLTVADAMTRRDAPAAGAPPVPV